MNLFTYTGNSKIDKSNKQGDLTANLSLAQANTSGKEVCKFRSKACSSLCVGKQGLAKVYKTIPKARIKKTKLLHKDEHSFLAQFGKDLTAIQKRAIKEDRTIGARPNTFSDIDWENKLDLSSWHRIRFYDYTKDPTRYWSFLTENFPSNYHLTFSRSETRSNHKWAKKFLAMGGNVAVVFRKELPKTYWGYKVIDGDLNDYRPKDPSNVIVGLRAKGDAKKDTSGFVVDVA